MGWVSRGCEGTGLTTRGVSWGGTSACGVSRGLRRGGASKGRASSYATSEGFRRFSTCWRFSVKRSQVIFLNYANLPNVPLMRLVSGFAVHLNDKSKFISGLRDDVDFCGCMLKPAIGSQTSWVQGAARSTVPKRVGSRVIQPSVASCCNFWCALCLAEPYA